MMRGLVVGSYAMRDALRDPSIRPDDMDIFTPEVPVFDPYNDFDTFWHRSFEEWIPEGTFRFATLDELYTIKLSHLGWDPPGVNWDKHICHALKLKDAGAKVDGELYRLLTKVWEEVHGPKKVNLNQDKAEFFTDAVGRTYDHDSIHRSVAYTPGKPVYEDFLKVGFGVTMDMQRVQAAPLFVQVALFREEVNATALERWVIPSNYTISPGLAYIRALRKTIVSLTKGWSTMFMLDNFREFMRPDNYVERHKRGAHYLEEIIG